MNFSLLIPEFVALGVLSFLLIREIVSAPPPLLSSPRGAGGGKRWGDNALWFTNIGGVLLVIAALFPLAGKTESAFSGTLVFDPLSFFFKILFSGILLALMIINREFFKGRQEKPVEFMMLLWTSFLGLQFLAAANNLLVMFVALETFTLSLYVMAAYLKKESASIEAGIKYLIMGSLASAFFVFGISLVFAATGSTSLTILMDPASRGFLTNLGMIFIIAGLGFKITSVPFQLWAPDVYEGAPTPVTAYLSVASKSAGFLMLLRILGSYPGFESYRTGIFAVLAALTLIYGNLGALVQTNIKRLFGYSSISHAGYLMIGLAAMQTAAGVSALLYYLLAFVISNLAAFTVITIVGRQTSSYQFETYTGLAKRSPFLAGMMFLALLSLAGVPPLAGFFGKFLVLFAAVQMNLIPLAILGAILVAVALYYYLSLVRLMYFETAADESPLEVPLAGKVLLIILAAGILIVGFWQAPFYAAAATAAKALF